MIKVGIIAPKESYGKNTAIQIFQKLKTTYGNTLEIVTGGNEGIEKQFKKVVLETTIPYKEFNPSYTGYNSFSALNESYYKKNYHPTHESDRYRRMVRYCDRLIIFNDNYSKEIESLKRYAEKQGKKYIEIKI